MAAAKTVDPLPSGAVTLSGKTEGPAVPLGRMRYARGQLMYLHETELRQACADFEWPNPETHQKVVEERDAFKAKLEEAQAVVTEQAAALEVLEKALGWRERKAAEKPAAKKTSK